MTDRLAEIKAHLPDLEAYGWTDDITWLIGKAEEIIPVIVANEELGAELVRLRGLLRDLEWVYIDPEYVNRSE